MPRNNWTRDELILAFNLYCKIPFGKIDHRNPEVASLAKALRRTPSALSWKLANFASLDSTLKGRQISGASHGSKLDRKIWDEFNSDWEKLSFESEQLLRSVLRREFEEEFTLSPPEGLSRTASIQVRINQDFFRAAVLAAYNSTCCITGLSIAVLLNASHIVPWAVDSKNRTNPRNGLCLNAIHDRAFDRGLITVMPSHEIRVCSTLRDSGNEIVNELFSRYHGSKIICPLHFTPDAEFLEFHNKEIFRQS